MLGISCLFHRLPFLTYAQKLRRAWRHLPQRYHIPISGTCVVYSLWVGTYLHDFCPVFLAVYWLMNLRWRKMALVAYTRLGHSISLSIFYQDALNWCEAS